MIDPRGGRTRPRRVGGDGDTEVTCADEQSEVPIDLERWRTLALAVLDDAGVRGAAELSVSFVDADTIAAMNGVHMGNEAPTDVLAFPIDALDTDVGPGPGSATRGPIRRRLDHADLPLLLGDVVVCPSVAVAQAPCHAGTVDDEIALLVVHGILHVLGYDHDTDEKRATMHAAERRLLEVHHWGGRVPDAFRHVPLDSEGDPR